jgi:flagellar motor switch/type III secretory pathway protein FliN
MTGRAVNTAPFDLRSCPPVRVSEARATRALAETWASLPRSWQADLPPFGAVAVAVAGIDSASRPRDAITLGLCDGRARGRLCLARPFAARLCDVALGGRGTFAAARPLGPAERGLLVGLLGPALDPIGWSLDLAPPTAEAELAMAVSMAVKIEGAFGPGVLWLDLPAGHRGATSAWRESAAGLPIEARLEIATTTLTASELVKLLPGDALVFDGTGVAALAAGADWAARLAIGAHGAAARVDPGGGVTLVGDFQLTGTAGGRKVGVAKEGTMDVSGPTEMATAALAAAPIEITAELARFTLRGEELLGLVPGVVLTVPADRRGAVVLRAGGEIWAEGELVDVEGELGVRVTRLLRP